MQVKHHSCILTLAHIKMFQNGVCLSKYIYIWFVYCWFTSDLVVHVSQIFKT